MSELFSTVDVWVVILEVLRHIPAAAVGALAAQALKETFFPPNPPEIDEEIIVRLEELDEKLHGMRSELQKVGNNLTEAQLDQVKKELIKKGWRAPKAEKGVKAVADELRKQPAEKA